MSSDEEVAAFIRAAFRSVWALELLCFLRQNRDRSLSNAEMVAGLRASDLIVTQSLDALSATGLVVREKPDSACYRPATAELEDMAVRTEALYAKSPNAVRRLIVTAANAQVAAFADAFRLRRD